MKEKGLYIFLALLAVAIVAIMVAGFNSGGGEKGNPYTLDIEAFKAVDSSLVHYRESRNILLACERPTAIAYAGGRLYIGADSFLQVIRPDGSQLLKAGLSASPQCILPAEDGHIYVAFRSHIEVYESSGRQLAAWEPLGENAVITSLALKEGILFAADAGQRRISRFSSAGGQLLGHFEGQTGKGAFQGFVVPSPTFDIAVNSEGELWVANPGNHSFEQYTSEGVLRTYWENTSQDIDGFTGCCNPAQMAFLPDGSFVTSEKRLVRIKVHRPSGEFACVVAPPEKFEENGKAPDIAVSPEGVIYALDLDRKIIRVFEKKEQL